MDMRKKVIAAAMAALMLLGVLTIGARAEEVLHPGDRVVIWNEAYCMALSAQSMRNFRAGVPVEVEEGTLTGFGDSEVWTVTESSGGGWRFENGGAYLSLDSVSAQIAMDGPYDAWELRSMGDGTYRIVNRDYETYLTWYSGREVYAVSDREIVQNVLRFYVLPEAPQKTETTAAGTQPATEVTRETDPSTEAPQETETTTAATQPVTEVTRETDPSTEAPQETETTAAATQPVTEVTRETDPSTEVPQETETTATTTQPATEVPQETAPGTEAPQETEPPIEEDRLDTGSWRLYFGQLHAHTGDSDGVGTPAEAFAHASEVPGLDFFALTEHSDSFDNDKEGTLTGDGAAISREWAAGKAAAEAVTNEDFVGIYGFEMSWNQGQGHISTFNTRGWLSRDQAKYQKYRNGMENYYEALLEVPQSISQFNHPGTLYGDFKNFAWYSKQVDALVTLIEVGSGAGGEYQTAYEYYTRALDQGWHVAPTNNQNNHRADFGDGDTNRTVVLASELTETGIYDALRNYRVYATEDSDLQIYYTLNGSVMGSQLSVAGIGDTAQLTVSLYDPTDPEWGRVDVITEGGAVAATTAAAEKVTFSLPATADYYYIRVTQPDGDAAVTAPIWLRQAEDLGISVLEPETPLTRAGEEQTIALALYNNEASPMTVTEVKLTDQNGALLGEFTEDFSVAQFETAEFTFPCCFETDGVYTLTATVSVTFEGESRVLTRELELSVLPVSVTSEILIDGTHGNRPDYRNFLALAAGQQISVHVETDTVTAEQLAACRLLIIPAPAAPFETEFLELVGNYVNSGGNLLLLGTAGGSSELNRLLSALGSTMALNEDTARDEVSNGGMPDQVYTADINASTWTEGITEGQTYAHVGGCTLDSGEGEWLVKSPAGDVLLAAEGKIIVAGSEFLEDTYLSVSDNIWALPYANRTIAENLLGITRTAQETAPIAQVRTGEPGKIYLVEGLVTAGTHNYNTTFPNTIYLQDATGGIAAVGYSEHGLELGRRVRIIGCLEENGGDPQLRIMNMEIFEKNDPVQPETVGNTLDHAAQGGELLQLQGTVISAETDGEAVLSFVIEDPTGARATVWIGDAIFSGSLGWNELSRIVQPGNRVSAVGLCHLLDGEAVLRVRDCDEVALLWAPWMETVDTDDNPPTGDTAFPVWAPVLMLLSLAMAVPLLRRTTE